MGDFLRRLAMGPPLFSTLERNLDRRVSTTSAIFPPSAHASTVRAMSL